MRHLRRCAIVAIVLGTSACGGSGGAPGAPSPNTPPGGRTITVTASGVSPGSLTVPAGSRVTFVNNDSRAHEMTSDPHPDHADCPEINVVGLLQAGQSRETGNLVAVRTCGFHDHQQPTNATLRGRIVVQ
jgi:plastocyanin